MDGLIFVASSYCKDVSHFSKFRDLISSPLDGTAQVALDVEKLGYEDAPAIKATGGLISRATLEHTTNFFQTDASMPFQRRKPKSSPKAVFFTN
jgi:hypothetical protein